MCPVRISIAGLPRSKVVFPSTTKKTLLSKLFPDCWLSTGASDTADQSVISLADSASNFDDHVGDEFDEVETVEAEGGHGVDLQVALLSSSFRFISYVS